MKGSQGKYFRLNYDIVVRFGATEFKAQYVWHENVRTYVFDNAWTV